jgi:Smg protein
MFDVLVYLYENYGALEACPDAASLSRKLADAGFEHDEISDAIAWLQELARITQTAVPADDRGHAPGTGFRVYTASEIERLGPQAIDFLAFLDAAGQLSAAQREIAIERAAALAESPVPLAMLKVIVLMVLWSQSADIDLLLLEELLDDGDERLLH